MALAVVAFACVVPIGDVVDFASHTLDKEMM